MSEIKELIERLCPDGVEYKKLGEVAKRLRGTPITATTMKKIATEEGEIKVFAGGKTVINAHLKDIPNANIITVPSVLCQSRGVIDFIYYDKPFTFKNEMWAYTLDNNVSVKYIYYVLKQNVMYFRDKATAMGAFPQISIPDTEKFEIPVPPLPVQAEIVRILDKFTSLEAELEAELEARRKQYEYYRNQLLTFDKVGGARFDVKWMTLGEIGEMIKGSGIQKSDFVEDGYPCIHYGQLHTFFGTFADKNKSFIKKDLYDRCKKAVYGDLIIASTSEDVEACCKATAWLGGEVAISGDAHIFHHYQNPKYIAYFFQTDDFAKQKRKYASGVKVVRVSSDNLAKIVIPIPPLEEQKRIVAILDRFEALTTDLQSGLPAEIEARRKQYEYYREKLLTF